jgi:hypothetical protein
MEKQMTLHIDNNGTPVTIVTQRASVKVGVQRYQMMAAADDENKKEGSDKLLAPLRLFTIVAGTVEVKGLPWPITFEEFVELDEVLVDKWVDAVHAVNPQWRGNVEPEEEVKKK